MNLALFVLAHDTARTRAAHACASMPEGTVVEFREPKKSREQEEKYHAIIGEIAANPPADALRQLNGAKLDRESWKRLLIDAFKHETYTDPDLRAEWDRFGATQLLPALNHPGFVMVGEQSRRFSKKLAMAFIDWLEAFRA
jgi:hypothetical protein